MQAQADANAKAQQAAADAQIQKNQAKTQADIQIETLKSQNKIAHLQEEVKLKKELMAYEFQLNNQIREQERASNERMARGYVPGNELANLQQHTFRAVLVCLHAVL